MVKGRILGILPLALARSSFGFGQDDKGYAICVNVGISAKR